ncbi:MAG TPA: hypothetical protein VER12_10270 [Polyangiaceae bacterium]|nr:hypothetical protein [Polyangiaceae bacterium]
MGMFTRLFGGKAGAVERSARLARAANLLPPGPAEPSFADVVAGQVTASFHAHDNVDGLVGNFLSAVSRGFADSGQRELVLTLRLENREPPIAKMQEIVRFFAIVHAWAQAGSFVEEGGLTQFGDRGLFGRGGCGLLYVDARPIAGVELPDRALAAVFVEAAEIRAAADFGIYRVLTRIGAQLRLFPFPTWGALDRPSAVTPRESESWLAKVMRMKVPRASFLLVDQCLRLSIPGDAKGLGRGVASLPAGASFALLTRPAPDANAILTWRPGQQGTSGISPEGSDRQRSSGSFVMFVPSDEGDLARPFEDGYSLLLSPDSWRRLIAALIEKQPFSRALSGGMRFELEWS